MKFVPLNIKTNNYLLSSMIKIKELVKIAKEHNLNALTITDNNMYGAIEFYKECLNKDIKPIIGLEVEIDDMKFVLYCMNYAGYQNLIKITTLLSEDDINLTLLGKYSDNLLAVVPYKSRKLYNDLKKIYQDIFIGYSSLEEKAKIKSTNTVYMDEILCVEKEDEVYLKYLRAIKDNQNINDIEINNKSLFPLQNFNEKNNEKICELCNLEIKFNQDLMPVVSKDSYKELKNKCVKGLKYIFGETAPKKYVDRLKQELNIIRNMGFCDYFLIVEDYVAYAKKEGILVGPGRGSAVGSLVAYLLNITTIDPIKYDLLFERFLNPERITMPDIDIDFEDLRRNEVIHYCINKYGADKVAPIITFGTLGPRQVLKDVGKILEIDSEILDLLTKMIDPKISLIDNYKDKKIKRLIQNNDELKRLYKISLKLEGLKRHTSVNAAGIVMANQELNNIIPLSKHNDLYITGYDKEYLEEIGLLKMDFLGIKNLNLISNILKEIEGLTFDSIPEDDKKAIEIFTKANTMGIFQFESDGMINFLRKLKAQSFNDVVAALALFRPGPMQNIDLYIKRKEGKDKVDYIHPNLESILKPTYGIIIYQEQIMQIARIMAGYSFAEADVLRRAMSKKKEEVLLKEKPKFVERSVKQGYSKDKALEVYNLILKFASYGFNKSHSVGYASVSYKMAYLKAHYPKIFMKNLLSNAMNSDKKTKEYIYECKSNNINIVLPDINVSENDYIIKNGDIVYPLNNIKGIFNNVAETIIEERNKGLFTDIFDFVRRLKLSQKNFEYLILAGCFDKLGYNRKTLIENLELIMNYGEIGEYLDDGIFKPELEIKEEYTKVELMNYEYDMFGFYISNHPITEYKLKTRNNIDLKDISNYFDKNIVTTIYVERTKTIDTKKNDKMMFITGTDELYKVDLVLFPKTYEEYPNVKMGDIIQINGHVEKRFDKYQIVVQSLKKMN